MAADEPGPLHQVGGPDRPLAHTQVRHGDRAGLLRVVDEIALREQIGFLTDDLDRVLVRADGAVGAQTVEHRGRHIFRFGAERCVPWNRRVRHVVDDADREVMPGRLFRQLVEDRLHHRRREFLGAEPVAAADHEGKIATTEDTVDTALGICTRKRLSLRVLRVHRGGEVLCQRGHHILIQRLADRAGFLRAIEHGDASHRRRQRRDKIGHAEGPT